jgi:PAS domain S-box-containing protein
MSKVFKGMENSHNTTIEIFETLSSPEITKEFPKEITSDALSIVVDAINSSVAGMIITDPGGIIRYSNPSFCKMFDYSLSEVIGRNAAELFATKEVRKFSDIIAIIDISRDDTEEFIVEKKDGQNFVVEVSASNVTSVSGKLVGRMASFIDITKRKEIEADREKLIKKLQDALDKIKVLRGILPICASCKKIRDDKGYWNQIENYIKDHSEANFTHGICPDCVKELYPEFHK